MMHALMRTRIALDELETAIRDHRQQVVDTRTRSERPFSDPDRAVLEKHDALLESVMNFRDQIDAAVMDGLQ